jgi:hypothetical protein
MTRMNSKFYSDWIFVYVPTATRPLQVRELDNSVRDLQAILEPHRQYTNSEDNLRTQRTICNLAKSFIPSGYQGGRLHADTIAARIATV